MKYYKAKKKNLKKLILFLNISMTWIFTVIFLKSDTSILDHKLKLFEMEIFPVHSLPVSVSRVI